MRKLWTSLGRTRADLLLLAAVSYAPALWSSPGRVSADSKQALYTDPGGFLAGAPYLWDPSTGAGTVPHQQIGYLWPMGPWFWIFDRLGVPDWLAQRLWLGTLTFLAALGARWLLRQLGAGKATALAAGLVYALSPYQLAFTARASVLLLPWVGLPWIVGLTRLSIQRGGWRYPAAAALVVASVAGVNAASLLLVALAPALLLVAAALRGAPRRAVGAAARIGLLCAGVSAFWISGLWVQGKYGMPVLDVTENLADVARWSNPGDVMRGLGSWFFAGHDRLGWSVDQARPYLESQKVMALTLGVPVLTLLALAIFRTRLRLLATSMIVVAAVVAVGAWPYDSPSAVGRLARWFTEGTAVGLAFRNSHRVVPVLLLGAILALGAAIECLERRDHRVLAAAAVAAAALAGFVPAAAGGLLSDNLDRDEHLPAHWVEAAQELDDAAPGPADAERVLEIPGSPFAAHRWGNTVEPVSASLLDRPQLSREVLPYGSPATANLLDALDRRMQEGIFEPASLAPLARLFASEHILVRSDLQYERYLTPEPATLWQLLTSPMASGLEVLSTYGGDAVNRPDPALEPLDERRLAHGSVVDTPVPPIGILQVAGPQPMLGVQPADSAVLLAGDGDGIVDAAAAGLIDGTELILYPEALDEHQLATVLDGGARVVLSDTQRRRIQTWFYAIRDNRGPTERAGETLVEPNGHDARLEPVEGISDDSRTVVEQVGAQVDATTSGTPARPEDRAVSAFDDDLSTAWRVGGADPSGERISVQFEEPRPVDTIVLVQPRDGPRDRVLESVRIRVDGDHIIDVALDDRSLSPEGQPVELGVEEASRLEIELTGVSTPPFEPDRVNAVGFAEIRVGDTRVDETVELPRWLSEHIGSRLLEHRLDVVLSRLRTDPHQRGRTDPERHLDRSFELSTARSFAMDGTARLSVIGPDADLDALLVEDAQLEASASSRLAGDLQARASSAIDGDPDTAWTSAFGPQEGEWLRVDLDHPTEVEQLNLDLRIDESHSVPTLVKVHAGDQESTLELDLEIADDGSSARATIPVSAGATDSVTVEILEVERRSAPPGDPADMSTLPVAITELDLGVDAERGTERDRIDTGCRDDLLRIDGEPLSVRVVGDREDVRTGLAIEACEDIDLDEGRHRLVATAGHTSGIDLDRLVLSSAPGGGPAIEGPISVGAAAERISNVEQGRVSWRGDLEVTGEPFWLVLSQSHNAGWRLRIDGRDLGSPTLVNGYANGWLVEDLEPGVVDVELAWVPQRAVWIGLAVSLLSILACLGLLLRPSGATSRPNGSVLGRGRQRARDAWPLGRSIGIGLGVGLAAALVSELWLGIVAAAVVVLVRLMPRARFAIGGLAPLFLAIAVLNGTPTLGWLALVLVSAAVIGDEIAERAEDLSDRTPLPAVRGP